MTTDNPTTDSVEMFPCANCGNAFPADLIYTLNTTRSEPSNSDPDQVHRGQSSPIDNADLCIVCHSYLVDALVRHNGTGASCIIVRQGGGQLPPEVPSAPPAAIPIEIPIAFPLSSLDPLSGLGSILETELRPLGEMMFAMQEEFRDAANTEQLVARLVGGIDPDPLFVGQPVSIKRAIELAAEIRKGVSEAIATEEAAETGDEKPAN